MFRRLLTSTLQEELSFSPAVGLLGPRQVGKTTLALNVARNLQHIYLDLESERDRAKLAQPELYLEQHLDKLVILDEVHRAPGLFPVLRGLLDQARRHGHEAGRYLLLGSASLEVLQQSGETLAGRIAYVELSCLNLLETGAYSTDALWLRGGFPASFLAPNPLRSARWRENFIRTYLERDIPQFGPRIAAETLRRFWTMLAHHQSGLLNVAQLSRNLGVDVKTAGSYLDLLCDLLLVRRLQPWHANTGKRLIKAPKVYLRDSGILHTLLNIGSYEQLLSHIIIGASWEGFCIENLLSSARQSITPFFYRTAGGAEIDLLLVWPDGEQWAIEIKRSLTPKLEKGFYSACQDLQLSQKWVVYAGQERYPLAEDIQAISLYELCQIVNNK
jgi:hypothetical protein